QASLVGQTLEEYIPAAGTELDATIHFPISSLKPQIVRTELIEDVSAFRFADTDASGIYKVTVGSDPREFLFAVNVPSTTPEQGGSESDLSRVDKGLMQRVFPGWDFQLVGDPRQANYAGGGLDQENVEAERGAMG